MSASIRQMYCCVVLSAVIGLATPATLRAEQPLSYRAYWKAAASPNPPNPNQSYNRYWQKVQAQREQAFRYNRTTTSPGGGGSGPHYNQRRR